jgi:hypothetical protein
VLTLAFWVGLELSRLALPLTPPPASRPQTLPVGRPVKVDPKTKLPILSPPTHPGECRPPER